MTASIFTTTRRRWVAPDGRTGAWGRAVDALTDAVRAATGQAMDPLEEWENVTRLWRGMQTGGWRIESEREWQ